MESYMKKEFVIIAIMLIASLSAVWYLGARSYDVTGTITDLQSPTEGEYIVTLTNNQQLTVKGNWIVFGALNETQLYIGLEVGQTYVFNCWGEPACIYKATPT